jgi:hypothetical protein
MACSRDVPPTHVEQVWDVDDPRLEERHDWPGYPRCGQCGSADYWRDPSSPGFDAGCSNCSGPLPPNQDRAERLCPACFAEVVSLIEADQPTVLPPLRLVK